MFFNNKIKILLGKKQLNKFFLLIIFTMFIALLETLGIGMVIPLVSIIMDPEYLNKLRGLVPFIENKNNKEIILLFLIIVCMIFILKNIIYLFYIYWSQKFNANIRKSLTNSLYSNFINQKYHFHVKKSSIELIKNINIDAEDVRFGMHHFFLGIAEFFICVSLLILLLFFNYKLTLIVLVSCFFIFLIYKFFIKQISVDIGEKRFEAMTLLQKHVKETLSNIKIIKIFSSKNFFLNEFYKHNNQYLKTTLLTDVIVNTPRVIIESTVVVIIVTLLYFSFNETESVSVFSSLGLYGLAFFRLMPSFNRMLTAYSYKNILEHTINKLYDILLESQIDHKKVKKDDDFSIKQFDRIKIENIKIENLFFSYENEKNILEDINLEINKNDFIGIVGNSGSGKSTFINLLLGLLEPNKGSIIYNDRINIYENQDFFNKRISYVPQNISILEKSVAENIAFGEKKEDIDIEKIKQIVVKTKLSSLISKMDNGLETIINSDNLNISGGELQRIGLARALYFDADLLVLDEATNSLDVKTENEILEMIYENFLEKKIIIFISHKMKNLEKSNVLFEITNKKIKKIY